MHYTSIHVPCIMMVCSGTGTKVNWGNFVHGVIPVTREFVLIRPDLPHLATSIKLIIPFDSFVVSSLYLDLAAPQRSKFLEQL